MVRNKQLGIVHNNGHLRDPIHCKTITNYTESIRIVFSSDMLFCHSVLCFMFYRDLKAENLLLGADGLWKLCDFGSTSTNHKRFEKPEEMGIEEDNIRKHTTPAYRAPEVD